MFGFSKLLATFLFIVHFCVLYCTFIKDKFLFMEHFCFGRWEIEKHRKKHFNFFLYVLFSLLWGKKKKKQFLSFKMECIWVRYKVSIINFLTWEIFQVLLHKPFFLFVWAVYKLGFWLQHSVICSKWISYCQVGEDEEEKECIFWANNYMIKLIFQVKNLQVQGC